MIGRVTCHILPHLSGVPHLHVNMPLVTCHMLKVRGEHLEREPNTERLHFWPLKANRSWYLGYFVRGFWYCHETLNYNQLQYAREQTENNVIKNIARIWPSWFEPLLNLLRPDVTFIHLHTISAGPVKLAANYFKTIESILLENIYCRS